jgi:hypothetical protein
MSRPDLGVLVVSCDAYSDLWPHFFAFFRRHWGDCPYPVRLGTNRLDCAEPGVATIRIGEDRSWSENLAAMLARTGEPYVLLMLEDFLLTAPADRNGIARARALLREQRADTVRLRGADCSEPPAGGDARPPAFEPVAPGTPWRVSAQAAIWDRASLLALLEPGWSPWQFESLGTRLTATLPLQVLRPDRSVLYYRHAVERGKWLPQGIENCRRAGLDIDFAKRSALTEEEMGALLRRGKDLRTRVLRAVVPPALLRWRQRMKAGLVLNGALERTRQRLREGGAG